MKVGTYIHGATEVQTAAMREIAAVLGHTVTRGPGAGELGSVGSLFKALADAYAEQPDRVLHGLGLALRQPWSLPEKYRLKDE